ncbi:MAG: LysR substrate-binding domain-containing protein [Sphingomonadaceae bacterium]
MQLHDWSDYQAFLAIARAGQLKQAGVATRIDPTTLGRRLRRLEERLGQTLFERTREGLVITEAGEQLLHAVEQMDSAAASVEQRTVEGDGPSGLLRISVSEGFGSRFLARYLAGFQTQNPRLSIDLVAQSGFLNPSKREADIAVMLSRPKSGPVIARKLSDYSLRLYASPHYLQTRSIPACAADLLEGHSLIGYIPDLLYAPELSYLDEIQPGLTPHLRSSSINAQHHLIVNSNGIGILPVFMAADDTRLVPVLPDTHITRSFWIVTHKDTHKLLRVRAFTRWLDDTVRAQHHTLMPK